MTSDEAITSEPAVISIRGFELGSGEIRWGHRGTSVEDVWLTGVSDALTLELWPGQDVTASVRKGSGALVIRRARVIHANEPAPHLRLWLSADDTRRITALWWGPAVEAAAPPYRPPRPREKPGGDTHHDLAG